MAERQGFEPWMSFWPILTFQASAFDHSATAPHALEFGRPSDERGLSQGSALCKSVWMNKIAALLVLSLTAAAPAPPAAPPAPTPSPAEIVAAAKADEWVTIAPSDLLIMDLAADAKGKPRRVVIQIMPPPFSQGWISNVRKLAAAKWWDGTSVNRVQDNYVVQWGDASEKKALPPRLETVPEKDYVTQVDYHMLAIAGAPQVPYPNVRPSQFVDTYGPSAGFSGGWPVAVSAKWPANERQRGKAAAKGGLSVWPIHCYGMVGVGRNLSPDTGSGAELYTVIGHAPRHLDRNVALIGRVIEGIEHLSSLPRGTEALGFYKAAEERVKIMSIRIAGDVPTDKSLPTYQYLSTDSATFAKYADARANRRDPFFNKPAGGADICNIPVPVRRAP
jgi:cyclophilin family peptidyl-prolyl cis-trans isomerase